MNRAAMGSGAGIWFAFAAAAFSVHSLQKPLAGRLHSMKVREDVYLLPPPEQVKTMSLGYHAATVDLLWAKLLVEYGIHHQEKRPFGDLEKYVDAVVFLEPDYAPLYKYVDTLFVFRPPQGTEEDARRTRAVLEMGIKARPYDRNVWLSYGEFLAFLAPSFLKNQEEVSAWRKDGANALVRAVELGAERTRGLSAASVLSSSGEKAAAVRHLQTQYALTDDPAEREAIAARLQGLQASQERDRLVRRQADIENQWKTYLPHVSKTMFLLVGPIPKGKGCDEPGASHRRDCARHWPDFFADDPM